MNIIADTNLLVRFFTKDDEQQTQKVIEIFTQSSKIIIPTNVLCELVWVLSSSYKFNANVITERISKLIENLKIIIKHSQIEFGLKILEQNGDFADGINAISGIQMALGQEVTFVSFDKKAVKILQNLRINAVEL